MSCTLFRQRWFGSRDRSPATRVGRFASERHELSLQVERLEGRLLLAAEVFVDDAFGSLATGTPIDDANPFEPGNQHATVGVDAFGTIQEGIDATDLGGTLLVNPHGPNDNPSGSYLENLELTQDITIRGTSGVAADVTVRATTGNGIEVSGADTDVAIENLQVRAELAGLTAGGVASVRLHNVVSSNNGLTGISVVNVAESVTLTDVVANQNGSRQFNLQVINVPSLQVTGGEFNDGTGTGISLSLQASQSALLEGVTASGNFDDGLRSRPVANATTTVTNSRFDDNGNNGLSQVGGRLVAEDVYAGGNNFQGFNLQDVLPGSMIRRGRFDHNVISGVTVNGFSGASAVEIEDVTMVGNQLGVQIRGQNADVTIRGLEVNSTRQGIDASGISRISLTDVVANNNGENAINLESISGSVEAVNVRANGSGAGRDNFRVITAGSVMIRDSSFSAGSNSGVRLNDIQQFAHLSNVQANGNSTDGLIFSSSTGAALTIDGNSSFSGNGADGVDINSGILIATGVTINHNGSDGIRTRAAFGSSVTTSEINMNAESGIQLNAGGSLRLQQNRLQGNLRGVSVDGGNTLLQQNDLNGNHIAAIVAQNGAVVDAGQVGGGADITGLGISTGLNDFSQYADFGRAFGDAGAAIVNLNESDSPTLLAQHNLFAVGDVEQLVDHVADDPALGEVAFSRLEWATTTTFTPIEPIAQQGQPLTLEVTVAAGPAHPTGTVTFAIDGAALAPVPVVGGSAQVVVPFVLTPGTRQIEATFNPTVAFLSSQAATSVTVVAPGAAVLADDPDAPGTQTLIVLGTDLGDDIYIETYRRADQSYFVTINDQPTVVFTGVTGRIQVFGEAGHDRIEIARNVRSDTVLHGGPGDDHIMGGGGIDHITGGIGNDTLDGGARRDWLIEEFDSDMTLSSAAVDGSLVSAFGTDVLVRNRIEHAQLTGGDSANRIDASDFKRGDVILIGGGGNDELRGGTRNDILVGGAGEDVLRGDLGRDLLVGGADADDLDGGGGNDLLIAGQTVYDDDPVALQAIMREWSRGGYVATVERLQGNRPGSASGSVLLNDGKVFDDGEIDVLTGDLGRDWFFQGQADMVTDAVFNEIITPEET